jgi:hypothetical protein
VSCSGAPRSKTKSRIRTTDQCDTQPVRRATANPASARGTALDVTNPPGPSSPARADSIDAFVFNQIRVALIPPALLLPTKAVAMSQPDGTNCSPRPRRPRLLTRGHCAAGWSTSTRPASSTLTELQRCAGKVTVPPTGPADQTRQRCRRTQRAGPSTTCQVHNRSDCSSKRSASPASTFKFGSV